jgi:periplasmic protein TonB
MAVAVVLCALVHTFVLMLRPAQVPRATAVGTKEDTVRILAPEQLKKLEDVEPLPADSAAEVVERRQIVPVLPDVPRVPVPADFVQRVDYDSLVRPELNTTGITVIPGDVIRGVTRDARLTIFNPGDLDRVPEPVARPAPVFPAHLKREGESATVTVEFVVDVDGRVVHPVVVQTTHPGFNDAALQGVARWRFRAGMRGGQKVNTRMIVPIVFTLRDE